MNFEDAIVLAKSRSDCHPSNIDSLVQIVKELSSVPGDIAECGSYKCGATIAMAAAAGIGKRVYAFDLFGDLPYGDGNGFENFADADFKEILDTTAPFQNIILFKGLHEDVIPKFVTYRPFPLALIFMDSDFYESHKVCLAHLWPLLFSGGKIVFHDWVFSGVRRAVQECIPADQILESGTVVPSPNMGYITKK
jgi:Macrocin-O-methyltransferase (TylF)